MIRIVKELFKPSVKCARIGHEPIPERRTALVKPADSRFSVADRVTEEHSACRRCGESLSPWAETRRSQIQSVSMDTPLWDQLQETGRVLEEAL